MQEAVVNTSAVEYPTSDGKPIAETDLHFDRLTDVAQCLKNRYADAPNVYVGANMLVYDEPGNPRRRLAPDVFVVFGVPNHRRDLLKIWDEKPPSFVLEITSKSTRREDMTTKRRRYAAWGVAEYFLYDPRVEYLEPPLQGLALREGAYRPMPPTRLPNGHDGYPSESLGMHLWLRESELRLFDPVNGRGLETYRETKRALDAAEMRTAELKARTAELEARTAELKVRTAKAKSERAELRAQIRRLTGE